MNMDTVYKLVNTKTGKQVELTLGEMDLAFMALEDYGSCIMDESSAYYDEQVESEYSGLMFKLGDI